MRKAASLGLGLLAAFSLTGCEAPASGSHLSIGTGNTGGIYYPFGGALASRLSAEFPDRQFTAEVTAASVENVRRLAQEQIDLGFAISLTAEQAYNGSADFPEPIQNLRIVAPLWPNPVNVLVAGNSDIETLADLRGQRVSVGSGGSGTEQVARELLGAYGMTYEDIQPFYLGFTETSSAIRDGSIAAGFLEVAYPASAVLEATTTGNVELLPLAGPEIDALLSERPVFFATTIPAGSYPGVDEDIPTVAELNWIVAREDLDGEVVRRILDLLQDEREQLMQVNPVVGQIDLAELRRAPIPLHPAAAAWAEENLTR